MTSDRNKVRRSDYIIAVIVALLILAWNLKNSFEFGRLAFVPMYDDISYFNDALARYHKFLSGNLLTIVRDMIANPPHSPIMTIQAITAYIIFGVQDWAPYTTLVWIPFLVVLLASAYTRDIGRGRWILLLYIATTPLLGASVVEFRPDIGNGILTALAIIFAVHTITGAKTTIFSMSILAPACFIGCALLLKPSAAIYTVGLICIAMMTTLAGLLITRQAPVTLALKKCVLILSIGFVVALPYYLVAGRQVIEYTYNAVVRDKSIWAIDMATAYQAVFYLIGSGGRFMLGLHFWVSMVSVLLLLAFRKQFNPPTQLRLYALIATAFVGYIVVTINPVKSPFIGVAFQTLLVCTSFFILSVLMRLTKEKWTYYPVVLILLFAAVLSIQPTGYRGISHGPYAQEVRGTVVQVNEIIRNIAAKNEKPIVTFVTFYGFLHRDAIVYDMLRHGIKNIRVRALFFRPLEQKAEEYFGQAINGSDIVIAASDGTRVAQSRMPSNAILPLTLSMIQENPEFYLHSSLPSGQGTIYVYQRKETKI